MCLVSTETPRSPRGAEQRGVHGGREGVRLGVSPGPVADHHAAPHQEDHPGRCWGPEIDRCGDTKRGGRQGGGVRGSGWGGREGGTEFTVVHINLHVTPDSLSITFR